MTTTLVTGANKGRGLETTRRLIAAGHTVHAGTRDLAAGGAARELGAIPVQLDVTDQDSVDKAIASLPELDLLVNNAAIVGSSWTLDDLDVDAMREAFETNVFGTVRVTQAALPRLRRSSNPVIVNVASGLGFPRALLDPDDDSFAGGMLPYSSSKAAVIALTEILMTDSDLRGWYLQYIAALDAHELHRMDEFIADEVMLNGDPGSRDDVLDDMRRIIDAVPNMHWEVRELLLDRDRIAVRAVNTGTPVKEWLGVSPTGTSFEIVEYAIYKVANGRFVQMTNLHDSADVRRQLTASPRVVDVVPT